MTIGPLFIPCQVSLRQPEWNSLFRRCSVTDDRVSLPTFGGICRANPDFKPGPVPPGGMVETLAILTVDVDFYSSCSQFSMLHL